MTFITVLVHIDFHNFDSHRGVLVPGAGVSGRDK